MADDEVVTVTVPRSSARTLARVLAAGLLAVSRADGGRPTPEAARLLRALHDATQGRGTARGTPPDRPATVDTESGSVLDTREAAAVLGCSPRYVRRLARTGRLPAQRVGGVWAVRPEDLDALRYGRTGDADGKPGSAPGERAADRG